MPCLFACISDRSRRVWICEGLRTVHVLVLIYCIINIYMYRILARVKEAEVMTSLIYLSIALTLK